MQIKLSSSAFQVNGLIPAKYTCDGDNVSPPLSWSNVPPNAKSIALIVDDPDAPAKTWVHWVVFDLPTSTSELPENVRPESSLLGGGKHGKNDFGKPGYGGPCPPSGTHRYFFKIYALDKETGLQPGATKEDLLRAMEGHILAQGELVGKYQRQ
jgi:Raf kinase inhibitor-like YbhB/YbcL family protein